MKIWVLGFIVCITNEIIQQCNRQLEVATCKPPSPSRAARIVYINVGLHFQVQVNKFGFPNLYVFFLLLRYFTSLLLSHPLIYEPETNIGPLQYPHERFEVWTL